VTSLQSLDDLFIDELRDIYSAEKQLIKALPKVSRKASSARLADAITDHLRQTEGHAERLERIFEALSERGTGKKCKGMEGLLEEGADVLEADGDAVTIDAAIIGAAQRVEHYEIAAYGTAIAHAKTLGNTSAAKLLEATLEEEKAADRLLSRLAEEGINESATEDGAEMPVRAIAHGARASRGNGTSKRRTAKKS
jgi:ferritin-like metal-binding protein YciE